MVLAIAYPSTAAGDPQRLGVLPAYWNRVERGQEKPPRDNLFCETGRLPPDLRGDIKAVVMS